MEQREQGYRPSALFNNSVHSAGIMNINQVVDDSQLVGVPVGAVTAEAGLTARVRVDVVEVGDRNGVLSTAKRRRGRPPRSHEKKAALPLSAQKKQAEEEDVCFICFDGGSLVLCDRRGCPKAYHPACIKRDESFFRSKAKWNCGWHICNSCQKASHYMCYTCPYSLCKGCTKDADYLCVRGNMGLCGTCMRTVMLIENIAVGNKETIQVDFDDMTSWEYLFKIYWVFLKSKLSLTLEELTKAKNPWKGDEIPKAKSSLKGTDMLGSKVEFSGEQFHGNDGKASCSDKFSRTAEAYRSKRKRTKSQPEILSKQNILAVEKSGIVKTTTLPEGTTWATKELLEFVAHMKNGDVSILSEFDVQDLVLDYVRTNNLRDPQQQSFIICDSRLITLFQKERVGYFEMLKLIEDHFLKKEKSPAEAIVGVAVTGTLSSQIEASVNNDCQLAMDNNKRQKAHWRQQINADPDEYAAIDVHNINLVYLKRCLLEHLLDDAENFHDKVVGSFVRVRVTGSDPKEDMYRLVLVVGTSKASESYILGTRRTNIMLEILNLDKKEVVLMDGISNQDFSEEECRRLCQSVKCGLIKRLTVGEIQKKAMMLRAIKVSGCLEAEILHINLLRDQASKMGHEKELRECLEKLERLKSPQECHRMLHEIPSVNTDLKLDTDEIPNVNTDPKLDADYDLDEDVWESNAKKQVEIVRPQKSEVCRKKGDLNSLLGACELLGCIGDTTIEDRAITSEQKSNMSTTYYVGGDGLTSVPREKVGTTQAHESVSESIQTQEVESTKLHGQNRRINPTGPGSMTNDVTAPVVVDDFETANRWHYQDPTGTVRGPFSIIHLRKWNMSGHFPVDMRVWRTTEKQEDSILLTDVLAGKLCKEPPLPRNKCILPLEIRIAANDTSKKWENGLSLSQSANATEVDCKRVDDSSKMGQNDLNLHCNGSNKLQEIDFFDIFSPMPKDSYDSFKVGANEMKQSASSNLPVLGSGPSLEDNRAQIPELADEWVGCSMAAPKTSVEGWDCNLLPASSMRPTEGASDHVVIPTSGSGQLTHGSMSNHQAIDLGCQPNGLGGIVEESVSDLLAELEAFESGDGLASPTSKMRCGELTQASEDCFSPIEDFDPAPDPGKSDAFTSSVNKIVNP